MYTHNTEHTKHKTSKIRWNEFQTDRWSYTWKFNRKHEKKLCFKQCWLLFNSSPFRLFYRILFFVSLFSIYLHTLVACLYSLKKKKIFISIMDCVSLLRMCLLSLCTVRWYNVFVKIINKRIIFELIRGFVFHHQPIQTKWHMFKCVLMENLPCDTFQHTFFVCL